MRLGAPASHESATADATGVVHGAAGAAARIVSLVPSITELLFALDLDAQIVGRTGFCVRPRERVRGVPKVGGTKSVKLDKLRALKPTHVIVNLDENEQPTIDALRQFVPHVVVTHPLEPRDNFALYALMGALFDREREAAQLASALEARFAALAEHDWPLQRVLYVIWRDPWMTVATDTYIAGMLRLVNWHTMPAVTGADSLAARYPHFRFDAPWLHEVDRILLASEPYRFSGAHAAALRRDMRLAGRPVQLVDGAQVSWYGSRAIEGIDWLMQFASR